MIRPDIAEPLRAIVRAEYRRDWFVALAICLPAGVAILALLFLFMVQS